MFILVGELIINFKDEMFLSSKVVFTPHFLRIVVEVKASGPLCLGVSKGILTATNPLFLSVEFF